MVRPKTATGVALVGFAEAMSAPEVAWSLIDEGFHVTAFSRKGRRSALRHSHHVDVHEIHPPESDIRRALTDLQALMSSLRIEWTGSKILFPLDDTSVFLCSKVPREGDWILAGPEGACADLALNKSLQVQFAEGAGFNVPETSVARSAKEVFDSCQSKSFPIILKAVECVPTSQDRVVGCRKWICANSDELRNAVQQWKESVPLLIQPFVTGNGEGVFGIAAQGGVRAWSAHKRLRMMNPQGSGSSACVSQPVQPELAVSTENLIRKTGWRGLFMIEILRDHSGKAWFMEMNGRPWGSMALSRRQGLEYPAWHTTLAVDSQSPVGMADSSRFGVVCRNAGREFMHLLFVLRGPRSKALSNWPSFWKAFRQVLDIRRRDAFYNWRREDPKVFFADCYYTIHSNLFKSRT